MSFRKNSIKILLALLLALSAPIGSAVAVEHDKVFHFGVSAAVVTVFPDDPVLGFVLVNVAGVVKEFGFDEFADPEDIFANLAGSSFGLVLRTTF